MKRLVILLLRLYQAAMSPFFGHCCRFFPSCSEYGVEAVEKYGPLKGIWLAIRRIGRCHPFHSGGYDPME